jgi:D-sedoheptulose 7-phosphate isomerase
MKEAKRIANICIQALKAGNKIMFCGNGGSAAQAQHLAAELVGKLNFERPALAALALTTDTSIITAIGNDYGFENVFSRQIEALGKKGDVLIGISTSGRSLNVINALKTAVAGKINIIDLERKGENTQQIQEYQLKLGHEFCSIIEKEMFA